MARNAIPSLIEFILTNGTTMIRMYRVTCLCTWNFKIILWNWIRTSFSHSWPDFSNFLASFTIYSRVYCLLCPADFFLFNLQFASCCVYWVLFIISWLLWNLLVVCSLLSQAVKENRELDVVATGDLTFFETFALVCLCVCFRYFSLESFGFSVLKHRFLI